MSTQSFTVYPGRYKCHGPRMRINDCQPGRSLRRSRDQEGDPVSLGVDRLNQLESMLRQIEERLAALENEETSEVNESDDQFPGAPELRRFAARTGGWLRPKLEGAEDQRRHPRSGRFVADQATISKEGENNFVVRCPEHGEIGRYSEPNAAERDAAQHNWMHQAKTGDSAPKTLRQLNESNARFWERRM